MYGYDCACCGIHERKRMVMVKVEDSIRYIKSCDVCYDKIIKLASNGYIKYNIVNEYGMEFVCKDDEEFEDIIKDITNIGLYYRSFYTDLLSRTKLSYFGPKIMSYLIPNIFIHRGGEYTQ